MKEWKRKDGKHLHLLSYGEKCFCSTVWCHSGWHWNATTSLYLIRRHCDHIEFMKQSYVHHRVWHRKRKGGRRMLHSLMGSGVTTQDANQCASQIATATRTPVPRIPHNTNRCRYLGQLMHRELKKQTKWHIGWSRGRRELEKQKWKTVWTRRKRRRLLVICLVFTKKWTFLFMFWYLWPSQSPFAPFGLILSWTSEINFFC